MKLLIIGGSGFIGTNLTNFLKKSKIDFLATFSKSKVKNKSNYIKYNLGNKLPKKIINFKPNVIIALAWHGIPNLDEKNSKFNIYIYSKFLNELDKLLFLDKIIFTGSCNEYFIINNEKNELFEKNQKLSISHFSQAKNKINSIYANYCKKRNISFIWLRIFFIYGRYQRKDSIIPSIINNLKKSKTTLINSPNKSLDFIHISDFILLVEKILIDKNILVDIFNCGSGKSYKLSKIYNIISKELKSKISYETDSDIKDKTVMYANIQKTKKYFNWYPKLSINSGIRKVIDEKN